MREATKNAAVITDNFGISSTTLPFLVLHQSATAINAIVIAHPAANTGRDNIPSDICTIFVLSYLFTAEHAENTETKENYVFHLRALRALGGEKYLYLFLSSFYQIHYD